MLWKNVGDQIPTFAPVSPAPRRPCPRGSRPWVHRPLPSAGAVSPPPPSRGAILGLPPPRAPAARCRPPRKQGRERSGKRRPGSCAPTRGRGSRVFVAPPVWRSGGCCLCFSPARQAAIAGERFSSPASVDPFRSRPARQPEFSARMLCILCLSCIFFFFLIPPPRHLQVWNVAQECLLPTGACRSRLCCSSQRAREESSLRGGGVLPPLLSSR